MRRTLLVLSVLCLCVAVASVGFARNTNQADTKNPNELFKKLAQPAETRDVPGGYFATSQISTNYLARYDFEGPAGTCSTQGWTQVDRTDQVADFWHVDNFVGLGGSYGPLEGSQSMWCGARADASSLILCGYASLPGYGNGWSQQFNSQCFVGVTGSITVDYLAQWDSEGAYDGTFVEWDLCDGNWTRVITAAMGTFANGIDVGYSGYSGGSFPAVPVFETFTVADTLHAGSIRIRFDFGADGAWSDSDGLNPTDGAFILDSLTVTDGGGVVSFENFELEDSAANGTLDGEWFQNNDPPYGMFGNVVINGAPISGGQQLDRDPCASHLTCVWDFVTASGVTGNCFGAPAQEIIPYVNARDQYFENVMRSPIIDLPAVLSGSFESRIIFYRDLPLDNLVFGRFAVRGVDPGGCPDAWHTTPYQYGGDVVPDHLNWINRFGDDLRPGDVKVQVEFWAVDQCDVWCGIYGTGSCHTNSPLYDNADIYQVLQPGPQWDTIAPEFTVFQDNFPTDPNTTGKVRIDAALDILPGANPNIRPSDSLTVAVLDPAGLAADGVAGGAAVHAWLAVWPAGQTSKKGPSIVDDASRWPVVDSTTGPNGNQWYKVRLDTAYVSTTGVPIQDVYCLDLNDDLFEPGDTITYFCAATNTLNETSYFFLGFNNLDNYGASGAIMVGIDFNEALNNAMEVTCLPGAGRDAENDILYIDDSDGRVTQPFWDNAFGFLGLTGKVDRYDVLAPSSLIGNGPGARVSSVADQLLPCYRKILWSSGDLSSGTIGDALVSSGEKADDGRMLYDFLDTHPNNPGLFINGEQIAGDVANASIGSSNIDLTSVYISYNHITNNHIGTIGELNPLAIGQGAPGAPFVDAVLGPDTLVAYGGCPATAPFDIITHNAGTSVLEMAYNDNASWGSTVSQVTPNNASSTARVMVEAFAFDRIRDDRPTGLPDRVDHLFDVITWMQNTVTTPVSVPDRSAYANKLEQNYPNPFNPTTTIKFEVKEAGPVQLKIYNVAGQLVKTLVNDVRQPGVTHTVDWNGRNNAGQFVSSGVYFYKLEAKNFVQTKKMVLLK